MSVCILETTNVVPCIKPWSAFAVRAKITVDSAVGLAVYSGSLFSMQFSKYRFLFLHYFQMNCTTGKIRASSCVLLKYVCQFNELLVSLDYNQVSLVYKKCFLRFLSGEPVLTPKVMLKYNLCFQNLNFLHPAAEHFGLYGFSRLS